MREQGGDSGLPGTPFAICEVEIWCYKNFFNIHLLTSLIHHSLSWYSNANSYQTFTYTFLFLLALLNVDLRVKVSSHFDVPESLGNLEQLQVWNNVGLWMHVIRRVMTEAFTIATWSRLHPSATSSLSHSPILIKTNTHCIPLISSKHPSAIHPSYPSLVSLLHSYLRHPPPSQSSLLYLAPSSQWLKHHQ